jgi:hypothetical protein
LDTSERAAEIQIEVLRRKTGAERLRLALDLSNFARRLAFARIRTKHPDYSQREVVREFFGISPVNE